MGDWEMKARRNGFASGAAVPTIGAAALVLATLVAVIGSAQAAPSQKKFGATVAVTGGQVTSTSAKLKLTLINDPTAKQTLGSANFAPPSVGITFPTPPPPVAGPASRPGWTVAVVGGVVEFRSTSNPLGKGEGVSADVLVNINQSSCTSATWSVAAKQSNDFSGSGNDFQLNPGASDLVALGSFDIATIETVTDDEQHVPAILTGQAKSSTTTAYDICGEVKTTYSGATRSKTFLTGAGFSPAAGLAWSNGVGTVAITPVVTETDNLLTVSDGTSGVTDTSNFFDTTDRLCTSTDTEPCEWSDNAGKLKVNSSPPPEDASLGIGFNSTLSFSCGDASSTVGATPLVNINPHYEETDVEAIAVTLTYKKSSTGNGAASTFDVCFRKDDVTTWTVLGQCASTSPLPAAAPCFISRKRVTGGDLEVVLWIATDYPWTGLG